MDELGAELKNPKVIYIAKVPASLQSVSLREELIAYGVEGIQHVGLVGEDKGKPRVGKLSARALTMETQQVITLTVLDLELQGQWGWISFDSTEQVSCRCTCLCSWLAKQHR